MRSRRAAGAALVLLVVLVAGGVDAAEKQIVTDAAGRLCVPSLGTRPRG